MQNNDNENTEHGVDWLDFKTIKATIEVRPVLAHFHILEHLDQRVDELVGWCPIGREHGKKDSFSFNEAKKSYQCFACKSRGSILDFIAKYQNVGLREAGKIAVAIGGDNTSNAPIEKIKEQRPYGKSAEANNNGEATPKPDKPADKKRKRGTEQLPIFTWQQAKELIESAQLNPDKLLVLNSDNLGDFLAAKQTAKTKP